ncbi:MAG: hypothetical protein IJX67_01800 [Oscillospiraceae bacterium]|nr:hypothetical protein [Oscillospiraceae bacterium]
MNNFELEIQMGTHPTETPVDNLIQALTAAGPQKPWTYCSDCGAGHPGFRLEDKQSRLVITLVAEAETEQYCQYCLQATNPEQGEMEMRSVEWLSGSNTGPLRSLYDVLSQALMDTMDEAAKCEEMEPEDDSSLTDAFINALIQDAQGNQHKVFFIRKGDGFYADSFGISESIITLVKEYEDNTHARFFFKMEKQDGTLIVSCAETSRNNDDEAELRKLYNLLDKQVPIVTVDTAQEDIRRFVEKSTFDSFYERVLTYAQPELPAIEPMDVEGKVLIHDLFNSVGETAIVRQFLDEIAMRRGPIGEQEMLRLKSLAKSVFNILRQTHRKPNGRVFTTYGIPVAFDKPGLASRGVRWSSSLQRIANSYINWSQELVGPDPAIGEGRATQKTAVLVLTALLADQLP